MRVYFVETDDYDTILAVNDNGYAKDFVDNADGNFWGIDIINYEDKHRLEKVKALFDSKTVGAEDMFFVDEEGFKIGEVDLSKEEFKGWTLLANFEEPKNKLLADFEEPKNKNMKQEIER